MVYDFASLAIVLLTVWIVVSGLDDLIVDFCGIVAAFRRGRTARARVLPEKVAAIFVPAWQEHRLIGQMIRHNRAAIDYRAYHFFIGVYPNDAATLAAARELERAYPNVHVALCPHDGPTSKADCLNWVYQRMLLFESQHGRRFELVLTHDAEDLIHSGSLQIMNAFAERFGMVQVPVLPLRTPASDLVHGIYCDDFAESSLRDMPARALMGSFIPSCGVGTAYRRDALERLAAAESNRIFEPGCLTEDYENGVRMHRLGVRQAFVPLVLEGGAPVATREYFPRTFRAAVRQRTRWVTGISLQTWSRYGWGRGMAERYWFWRDRKGLAGNPLSLAANGLTLAWLAGVAPRHSGLTFLFPATLALVSLQIAFRMICTGRVYGWRLALGVPLRVVVANLLNSAASMRALLQYFRARLLNQPLVWLKTEHAYPSLAALESHKRTLEEVLTGEGYLTQEALNHALASRPGQVPLQDHLAALRLLTEEELCEAISLQTSVPTVRLREARLHQGVLRSLPARIARDWTVLPFKVEHGTLHLAGPKAPGPEMLAHIGRFTRLEVRCHLITAAEYADYAELLR